MGPTDLVASATACAVMVSLSSPSPVVTLIPTSLAHRSARCWAVDETSSRKTVGRPTLAVTMSSRDIRSVTSLSAADPKAPAGQTISAVTVTTNQRWPLTYSPSADDGYDVLDVAPAIAERQGHEHNVPSSGTVVPLQVSGTCPCTLQRSTVTIPSTILAVKVFTLDRESARHRPVSTSIS